MNVILDEVVLVDDDGRPIGRVDRNVVHSADTPRHLAFSCWIVDSGGAVLLTRRALGKRSWPGVWSNACCGHPRPGEPVELAVARRLGDELGIETASQTAGLSCLLPAFSYRATDPAGIVENELCPVYRARLSDRDCLRPDPDEVMDWVWTSPVAVAEAARWAPYAFSPWAVEQLALLGSAALGPEQPGQAE